MANYLSELSGAQLESALTAVSGLIVPKNNNKIITVENGTLKAKSVTEIEGGTLGSISITSNGSYAPSGGVDGYDEIVVNVPSPVAFIEAISKNGYVCTCSNGQVTISGNGTGSDIFSIPSIGTWTLTCDGNSTTVTVAYGDRKTKKVNLRDELEVTDTRHILTIYNYNYYKANAGLALVCWYKIYSGNEALPLLVSKDQDCVAFKRNDYTYTSGDSITYNGEVWYYSATSAGYNYSVSYADPNVYLNDITGVYKYNNAAQAAPDLLNYYFRVI